MYKFVLRPLLFLLPPETIHSIVARVVKALFSIPGIKYLIKKSFSFNNPSLKRNVFGIQFDNPVGLAAGFDKNADLFNHFDAFGFSFIEVGTVTPLAQTGNPKPRSFRLKADKALINRMGFNNYGVINAKNNLKSRKNKVVIGGNIGKNTSTPNANAPFDYLTCFKELYDVVDYFVVNVSCPNIKDLKQLQDVDNLRGILSVLVNYRSEQSLRKPILLKVSPDLTPELLDSNIEIAQEYGIDGFVATNTTVSRNGLKTEFEVVENIGNGGLSGGPLKDRSTEIIRYIHSKTNGTMPIIGVGGILTPEDAIEKLKAGASLVQIYTGFIYTGPSLVNKICKSIANQ
jgi:dihydroorotate dehydrogenase